MGSDSYPTRLLQLSGFTTESRCGLSSIARRAKKLRNSEIRSLKISLLLLKMPMPSLKRILSLPSKIIRKTKTISRRIKMSKRPSLNNDLMTIDIL